jgi:hypothetical protein
VTGRKRGKQIFTINIGAEPSLQQALALIESINSRLESLGRIECTAELALIGVQVDRVPAGGTNDYVIRLKPSERLMELVAAARTSEIERSIA